MTKREEYIIRVSVCDARDMDGGLKSVRNYISFVLGIPEMKFNTVSCSSLDDTDLIYLSQLGGQGR